jgi:hypothetical protein
MSMIKPEIYDSLNLYRREAQSAAAGRHRVQHCKCGTGVTFGKTNKNLPIREVFYLRKSA